MYSETEKIKILLVDDNPSNLLVLESILATPDRELVRAASGDEALRYLLQYEVALVLLDVQMPFINGLETAALIRQRQQSRNTPIIFLTAHDSAGKTSLAQGYSLGAVDYLIKPLDREALRAKVAVFVELFRKTEQIKAQAAELREKNLALENSTLLRLAKLIELGQQLTAEREPTHLLTKFCAAARDIIGAHYAVVGMNGNGQARQTFLASHNDSAVLCNQLAPATEAYLVEQLEAKRSLRLAYLKGIWTVRLHPEEPPVPSLLGVAILTRGQRSGWLYLGKKLDAEAFSEADERLAITLADQVAVAYENATLYAETQKYARALEREIAERRQIEKERTNLLVREQQAHAEVKRQMEQLASLNAELQRANVELDEFSYIASHDLKEPLRGIHNYAHFLYEDYVDKLDATGIEMLHTLAKLAERMQTLIDSLLHYSRTNRQELEVDSVDLGDVLAEQLELLAPILQANHVTISIPCPLPVIQVDRTGVSEILSNLIINASKYNDKAEKWVEVGVLGSGGGEVTPRPPTPPRPHSPPVFYVRDNGIGIPAEHHETIFRIFKRLHGRDEYSGVGVGLTIVKKIIERHGGKIWVESKPGIGTTFFFILESS